MTATPTPASSPRAETGDDLVFRPSPGASVGVELELQIVDGETGDLAPASPQILDACRDEHIEGVSAEFLLSMLEVKTGICPHVGQARRELFDSLRRVRNITRSLGFELALGGTHPFGRASMSAVFPDERYQRIRREQGAVAYQQAVFGLHVHVGVPGSEAAIGAINVLVPYLPHLLAASANSPFWQGVDSGYASARVAMFRPSAHAGLPPRFARWQDFRRYFRVMHGAGVIEKTKDLYWDIRPRPHLGTIEFRICDAPSTLAFALGIATLARCLVQDALARIARQPALARGDDPAFWLTRENRWRASRFGLRAELLNAPDGSPAPLADDLAALVERMRPWAGADDAPFLEALQGGQFETGAERQRRIYRETGSAHSVLEDMKERWPHELEETAPTGDGPAPIAAHNHVGSGI